MNTYNKSADLVKLIILRNPLGYTMLVENYSSVLYGSIMRMVKDVKTAENLLALTFNNICNSISQYSADRLTFLTWTLQLARSASIDYLCVNSQNTAHSTHFISDYENAGLPANVELIMMPTAESDETTILNKVLQGYKVGEIAAQLNLPVEAVKLNIRKGMKQITNRS